MAYISAAIELQRLRDAISEMTKEELIQSGYTNGEGQQVIFRKWQDVTAREKYLESQASIESNKGGRRKTMMVFGNGGIG